MCVKLSILSSYYVVYALAHHYRLPSRISHLVEAKSHHMCI